MLYRVIVAEWLARGSGELDDPSSNPLSAAADLWVIAEWPICYP